MRGDVNSNGMRFHFGWKSHFGVQSALYLCSHELRQSETQNGMDFLCHFHLTGLRFSCEHNLTETKWISADSLDVGFNARVRLKLIAGMDFISVIWQKWNFISGDEISCKHYPKWNAYTCPSKYRIVLKCSRNKTSFEQNLF